MTRKIVIILIALVFAFQSVAFAAIETEGDVVFRDALYGAIIGAIVGGAVYLADQDDIGIKLGMGVAVGTVGGLAFGIYETRSVAEIDNNQIKFAIPTPVIQKRGDEMIYAAPLLKVNLD